MMRAAGQTYHKSCFTCQLCNKRVDSSMLCEREGEIFCRYLAFFFVYFLN
jgi:hypothetical protein